MRSTIFGALLAASLALPAQAAPFDPFDGGIDLSLRDGQSAVISYDIPSGPAPEGQIATALSLDLSDCVPGEVGTARFCAGLFRANSAGDAIAAGRRLFAGDMLGSSSSFFGRDEDGGVIRSPSLDDVQGTAFVFVAYQGTATLRFNFGVTESKGTLDITQPFAPTAEIRDEVLVAPVPVPASLPILASALGLLALRRGLRRAARG